MIVRVMKLFGGLTVLFLDKLASTVQSVFGIKKHGTCVVLYYHTVKQSLRTEFAEQMHWVQQHCKPIAINSLGRLQTGVHHVVVTFDDGFQSVIENGLPELTSRDIPSMIFVAPGWLGKSPCWPGVVDDLRVKERVIDTQQLKDLKLNPLVSIGSHCISHPCLPDLEEDQAREEIIGAKIQLEKILGDKIDTLSFPFGEFNEAHVEMAYQAGYKRVFSTFPELIRPERAGSYVVGRIAVEPTDWLLEFRLKALGAYRWIPLASTIKHGILSYIRNWTTSIVRKDNIIGYFL